MIKNLIQKIVGNIASTVFKPVPTGILYTLLQAVEREIEGTCPWSTGEECLKGYTDTYWADPNVSGPKCRNGVCPSYKHPWGLIAYTSRSDEDSSVDNRFDYSSFRYLASNGNDWIPIGTLGAKAKFDFGFVGDPGGYGALLYGYGQYGYNAIIPGGKRIEIGDKWTIVCTATIGTVGPAIPDPNNRGSYGPVSTNSKGSAGPTSINAVGSTGKYVRTSGSFILERFEVGDKILVSGYSNAGNNGIKYIQNVTALEITITDNTNMVAESGTGDESIVAFGAYTGDHTTTYTLEIIDFWGYVQNFQNALLQISLATCTDIWLDYWGEFFGLPRLLVTFGLAKIYEDDETYRSRIMKEITRAKGTRAIILEEAKAYFASELVTIEEYHQTGSPSVVVGTDGRYYTCILNHTSNASRKPITGGSWATYWKLGGLAGNTWVNGFAYTIGSSPRWDGPVIATGDPAKGLWPWQFYINAPVGKSPSAKYIKTGDITDCECNSTCYGNVPCFCDSTCYGDPPTCECDSTCYGEYACSCDTACYTEYTGPSLLVPYPPAKIYSYEGGYGYYYGYGSFIPYVFGSDLFPVPTNVGDAILFGNVYQFSGVKFMFSTPGVGGGYAWEYWNGSGWTTLTSRDTTSGLTADGFVHWLEGLTTWEKANDIPYNIPDARSVVVGTDTFTYQCKLNHTADSSNRPITGVDWATYWTLGGTSPTSWVSGSSYIGGKLYWVRCIVDSAVPTTVPKASGLWLTYAGLTCRGTYCAKGIKGCFCDNTCYGYQACSCNLQMYGGSLCACNVTCYGDHACDCNAMCYSDSLCSCDMACHGYTSCSCNAACHSEVCTTCYNTCYGYSCTECDSTCYGDSGKGCSCNSGYSHTCTCDTTWYSRTCTCEYACYGDTSCTCDLSCYGYSTCSCDSSCYGDSACSCDGSCHAYIPCICDATTYGYSGCSCNAACFTESAATYNGSATLRDRHNCYIYFEGSYSKPTWESGLQDIVDRLKVAGTAAIINPIDI